MSQRKKIALLFGFGLLFGGAIVLTGGCGVVHGTDGRTTTILGFGRTTEGQTQTEAGIGKGMDGNLSQPRANTFSNRSSAASSVFGEGN